MPPVVRPKRILVLDDEPGILSLLGSFIRTLEMEPLITPKWTEALEWVAHDPPDLVLLDLHMPTVQGESVLEFLRGQGIPIPVIVISAYLDPDKKTELQKMGGVDCLAKPFQLGHLADMMRKALAQPEPPIPSVSPPPPHREEAMVSIQPAASLPPIPAPRPREKPFSEPAHHHTSHRRPRPRSPRNRKVYFLVFVACLVGSLVLVLLERLPSYTSQKVDQALDRAVQSETRRQQQKLEGLSDKEKEALRRSLGK